MSKTGTMRVTRKPDEAPPRGETDWARVNAMTDEEVLAAASSDPDAQPLDPEALAKMRRISPVKALRQRLGMTQAEFAEAFRLPISTLRDWEPASQHPRCTGSRAASGDRARARDDAASVVYRSLTSKPRASRATLQPGETRLGRDPGQAAAVSEEEAS